MPKICFVESHTYAVLNPEFKGASSGGEAVQHSLLAREFANQGWDTSVVCLDVGNNTYSFGRYFECRQQRILMSGYLGSIGFGFPAAMGAWAATRDFEAYRGRKVISVSGDGGFGQYLADFNTAVKFGMDITHILLHNDELGKISKEQKAGEWPVWQTSLHNPNFSSYAKLRGGFDVRVKTANKLEGAMQNALNFDGPAIVEIMSDTELI